MDKIYSRKRIHLPKVVYNFHKNDKNYRRNRKIVKIITILFIAMITATFMIQAINPIFEELCETEAKSIATIVSNEKATEIMGNYRYQDLVTIMQDNNGNITAIKSNVIPINEIISNVAIKIQEELNSGKTSDITLSLGSMIGSKMLSGSGPKIKIKIMNAGTVETDYRSEFKAAGINQTLHRLYLEVKCRVVILTPFNTIEKEITNQVILVENIIVGTVPSTYYNLEGLEQTRDLLEVIE